MVTMIYFRNETEHSLGILERYGKDPEVRAAATAELNRRIAESKFREATATADRARRYAEAKLAEGLLRASARQEIGAALREAFELGRKVERGEPLHQSPPAPAPEPGSIVCARCKNPATLTVGDEELCDACAEAIHSR